MKTYNLYKLNFFSKKIIKANLQLVEYLYGFTDYKNYESLDEIIKIIKLASNSYVYSKYTKKILKDVPKYIILESFFTSDPHQYKNFINRSILNNFYSNKTLENFLIGYSIVEEGKSLKYVLDMTTNDENLAYFFILSNIIKRKKVFLMFRNKSGMNYVYI